MMPLVPDIEGLESSPLGELTVIGSSNTDMVISLPRIPLPGETLLGGRSELFFGGKGANQAIAAARAGGRVLFITRLGNDLFGRNMLDHFRREGLPDAGLLLDQEEPTGMAQIWVSEGGENAIAVAPGANSNLLPADIESFGDPIKRSGILLMQLEIPIETVCRAVDLAFGAGVRVILNPAPAKPLSPDLLRKVWLLTPNESEATILTGLRVDSRESAMEAGGKLIGMGVRNVIVTLGKNGSVLCNRNGARHFRAFEAEAVDTTGAGDVFNGFLAVALANGRSLEESIPFGSAAAALSVSRRGAQTSIPVMEEVERFMQSV